MIKLDFVLCTTCQIFANCEHNCAAKFTLPIDLMRYSMQHIRYRVCTYTCVCVFALPFLRWNCRLDAISLTNALARISSLFSHISLCFYFGNFELQAQRNALNGRHLMGQGQTGLPCPLSLPLTGHAQYRRTFGSSLKSFIARAAGQTGSSKWAGNPCRAIGDQWSHCI